MAEAAAAVSGNGDNRMPLPFSFQQAQKIFQEPLKKLSGDAFLSASSQEILSSGISQQALRKLTAQESLRKPQEALRRLPARFS